ncbi:Panacea domain-containing protein [Thalassospira xiamenensis]|uniref:Panacea domain-containing protein n=1 Tax=Thalassospira xiamenensis TaxID=220697 RepID=UPI00115E8D44|nr:type II toxin-antitoxin system antitoxin SocA domain-containing protein [Thalassospira xiamenensis]
MGTSRIKEKTSIVRRFSFFYRRFSGQRIIENTKTLSLMRSLPHSFANRSGNERIKPDRGRTNEIANYFLRSAASRGQFLNAGQVLKLTYLAHAHYLGQNNEPLVKEPAIALNYGPTFSDLYADLSSFRMDTICQTLPEPLSPAAPEMSEDIMKFLDNCFEAFGHLAFKQLAVLARPEGSPWHSARQQQDREISNTDIAAFYAREYAFDPNSIDAGPSPSM